jgi:hypothetical protein
LASKAAVRIVGPGFGPVYRQGSLGESVDIAQFVLLLVGWTVAFLLGKELQAGFVRWRETRGRE